MFNRKSFLTLAALTAALVFAPVVAQAGPIFTFGFTDLSSDFTRSSGLLETRVVEATDGDVTRTIAPIGTANMDGLFADATADFVLDMTVGAVSGLVPGSTAPATGTFLITGAGTETISGTISGTWRFLAPGFVTFDGTLGSIINSNGFTSGTFTGTDASSISTDFDSPPPFNGAIVSLTTGSWFGADFPAPSNTGLSASVIPAPGAALLGAMGLGLVASRRRRQR